MSKIDLYGEKVLVIGSGLSGIGAVKLLREAGAIPVLLDENEKAVVSDIRSRLGETDSADTRIIIGKLQDDMIAQFTLAVPSPAVPLDSEIICRLRDHQVRIWSEIELAYNYAQGRLIAITGTNGKTTTTTLVGEIMKAYYSSVFVVGNIGYSYAGQARSTQSDSVTVAEISSFQLETVENFHANVSAILNITPDHLNRHHTMECYVQMKEQIANGQTQEDTCVLNYDNDYTRAFGKSCPAKVVFFSSHQKLQKGLYLDGEEIILAGDSEPVRLMNVHDMNLVGLCNVENVMAAIAVSLAMQVPMETILRVVRAFKAVEHRIEFVATKRGVDYYNDSKGTNPDAAIQGIRAMSRKTYLIGGGYDKGSEYDEWIESFDGKVKELVLIGQTKEKIAACAEKHGFHQIHFADTFEDAMNYCTGQAQSGEAVLLSPACASWDMFPNYETRGRIFKSYVNHLDD